MDKPVPRSSKQVLADQALGNQALANQALGNQALGNKALANQALANQVLANQVLASLTAADLDSILPHLRSIELPQEMVLFEAGDAINRVIFPHGSIVSLSAELATGETIEPAMIG